MNAFITGSHAYGTPTEKSDVDLVVLASPDAIETLARAGDDDPGSDVPDGASLRFGKLNLILVTNPAMFDAWKAGTEQLVARKPVTRDEAIAVLAPLRNAVHEAEFTGTLDAFAADVPA